MKPAMSTDSSGSASFNGISQWMIERTSSESRLTPGSLCDKSVKDSTLSWWRQGIVPGVLFRYLREWHWGNRESSFFDVSTDGVCRWSCDLDIRVPAQNCHHGGV